MTGKLASVKFKQWINCKGQALSNHQFRAKNKVGQANQGVEFKHSYE